MRLLASRRCWCHREFHPSVIAFAADEDIEASTHCPIEEDKPLEELRQEPLPLPEGFVWCDVDLAETAQLTEVYELLAENYVEDDDCLFRFNYSPEFLVW